MRDFRVLIAVINALSACIVVSSGAPFRAIAVPVAGAALPETAKEATMLLSEV